MEIEVLEREIVSYETIPTVAQFEAYQNMFNYFNEVLFRNQLPNILLNFSRKGKNCGGFFAPERWLNGELKVHEISLNPDHWQRDEKIMISTLVHEMAHLWQQVLGKPARMGYHNKEWGTKMKEIGLHPSNTSEPGGKETGQKMSHYIVDGGKFEVAFNSMPQEYLLPLRFAMPGLKLGAKKSKFKYECPTCEAKIWGKKDMSVKCLNCNEEFQEAE